jgi:hypothetical protein
MKQQFEVPKSYFRKEVPEQNKAPERRAAGATKANQPGGFQTWITVTRLR